VQTIRERRTRRERRTGGDRRSGVDRRQQKKPFAGRDRRTGVERRSGRERRQEEDRRGRPGLRIPIFVKIAILATTLILIEIAVIGFVVLEKEKEQYFEQLIGLGESMVRILTTNAPDKLLGEEDLALFKLMEDMARHEPVVFAMITDVNKIIRAHSDLDQVDRVYTAPPGLTYIGTSDGVIVSTFHYNGEEVLLFESPLLYQGLEVGRVRLGLSTAEILTDVREGRVFFLYLAGVMVAVGILLSLAISLYFSRPINKLRESVLAVGRGDFSHRILLNRKDELGELGEAMNRMSEGLALKEHIQDSFGKYVAPEIVEMILAHPEQQWMRGARVNASILFVDIRGFTSLSEDKDPAWIVDMLNDYFTRVTDTVIRHGGSINKFLGDEAMAIFGAPIANHRHADSAVRAALEIRESVRHIGSEQGLRQSEIRVGVGVNSGAVVAGNLGSEKRMEYTVIGDDVNVASRLTAMAKPGEILISKQTYDQMEQKEDLRVEARGSVSVKGRKMQISVYNVVN
jgi:adenylate cyclase